MYKTRKRPLRDHNLPEVITEFKVPSSTISARKNEVSHNAEVQKRVIRTARRMISQAVDDEQFCIRQQNSCQIEESSCNSMKEQNIVSNEDVNCPQVSSTNSVYSRDLVKKVNSLFKEDLRCPQFTPFDSISASCSSVRDCACNNHKTPVSQISQDDEQVLRFLVCEKCWYLLVTPLSCHITKNSYLSPLLFRSIFYGITVESDEEICLKLVDVLKRHLQLHPPCRKDLKPVYHKILFGNVKLGELGNPEFMKYEFRNIVKEIEKACKNIAEEVAPTIDSSPIGIENELKSVNLPSSIDDLFTYISKAYIENNNILSLPEFNYQNSVPQSNSNAIDREALLFRLFLIFNIAVDILEVNFRMWWMRSRYKLQEKLRTKHSSPFVADIAWKIDELKGSINEHCVQVFMLFTICPQKYKHHLSRYIRLLFEVARANENNKEVRFPFFGSLCTSFATELAFHIKGQSINGESVSLVQQLMPEWLKFKVCGILLNSDITSDGIDDLKSVCRILLRNLTNKPSENTERVLRSRLKLPNTKVNSKNSAGETVIHLYCRTNKSALLKKHLQHPETNVNLADNTGWTPLHNAAKYNSIDCLNCLIQYRLPPIKGADQLNIYCLNSDRESPLMCAVKEENVQVIAILLKAGAGPTVHNINSSGVSSLDLAQTDLIRNMLLNSWKESISVFEHLQMSITEVDILTLMLTSYCSAYHIRERCKYSDPDSVKHDAVYSFNYSQYYNDESAFDRLCLIVNKLCTVATNPKNLQNIQYFLKSYS